MDIGLVDAGFLEMRHGALLVMLRKRDARFETPNGGANH